MIGEDVALRIAEEVLAGRDPRALHEAQSGGEKFDFIGLIELVGSAIGIVAFGLECKDRFERKNGRRQSAKELESELLNEAELRGMISEISDQISAISEFLTRDDSGEGDDEKRH
ncbi:hypothetical protein [Dactylosporangium sp. CA-139066]|uniref:hypothetical protein n=1 Tax=Dactylosporangium sp. CA-139066 TaxID=3239930 RepID=UPI003D8D0726